VYFLNLSRQPDLLPWLWGFPGRRQSVLNRLSWQCHDIIAGAIVETGLQTVYTGHFTEEVVMVAQGERAVSEGVILDGCPFKNLWVF